MDLIVLESQSQTAGGLRRTADSQVGRYGRRGCASRWLLAVALVSTAGTEVRRYGTPAEGRDDALVVEVTGLDGQVASGRLVQLVPEIVLQTDAGHVSTPWSEVLTVRPRGEATATRPAPPELPLRFDLADGSSFGGQVVDVGETGFIARLSIGVAARLDLAMLRSVAARFASSAAREKFSTALAQSEGPEQGGGGPGRGPELGDSAVVARGQEVLVLHGRVRRIAPENVVFEWNGREVALPWDRVGGLIFARPSPRAAACVVRLRSGDTLAGRVAGGSEQALTLRSGIFDDVQLPWSQIERIDCHSERLVFLSDLKPVRYEFEPFFDKKWNFTVDQTLTGNPIRLGGREYARGVTMHSRAALTYRLDGRFEQFATVAGIVDEMDGRGCVTLRVIGDERVLWEAAGVRGGQPPREVVVSVVGVQELTLVVDFDEELDLSDHAAWGLARLIR